MRLLADPHRLSMINAWAAHDVDTFHAFSKTMRDLGVNVRGARVLDVGCGANAPMTLLLKGSGAEVTGIDYVIGHRWGLGFKANRYTSYVKQVGLPKTVRKMVGELVYDRSYYRTMRERSGLPISEVALDLREMEVTRLDFRDEQFDVIHSNATWEHLLDVPRANREVARVLKPGGVAYIEIHLFPCISGGHDLPWIVPGTLELGDVEPWRHLRDPKWQSPGVPLNRWAEGQYRQAFESTPGLAVVDWLTEYTEGEAILTDAIRRDLPAYTDRDLTTRSIIVVLRKQ